MEQILSKTYAARIGVSPHCGYSAEYKPQVLGSITIVEADTSTRTYLSIFSMEQPLLGTGYPRTRDFRRGHSP